jgi:hypothetical protein
MDSKEHKKVERKVKRLMTKKFLKELKADLDKAEETCKEIDRISKIDHKTLLEPFNI